MENPDIKKNFTNIIIVFFVWMGGVITILSCMNAVNLLDIYRGADIEIDTYLGMGAAITVGFGFAGAGIFFSIASLTMGMKKPELVKVFGIIIFVLFMAGMAIMGIGAIALGASIAEIVACSLNGSLTEAMRLHCQNDIGYNVVIVICMVAMAVIAVLGIMSTVKIVTILNNVVPRSGFVSTQPASAPSAAAAGSKGKFCSSCGAANAIDAKFCKGCGKAC